jgi:hypothetical protein
MSSEYLKIPFVTSKKGGFLTNLSLLENLQIRFYGHKSAQEAQGLQGERPGCRPGGAHQQDSRRRPMWSPAQEINNSRNNRKIDGVRGLEIHILCFEERSIHV